MSETQTETWYFVTRNFKWQSHGQVHTHRVYLVGVRYPVIGDGPYCGPNPESATWVEDPEKASRWDTEEGAAIVARCTRDIEAKVEKRTVTVDTIG